MAYPSLDDLVHNVKPGSPEVLEWIEAHAPELTEGRRPSEPLPLDVLLDLGFGVELGSINEEDADALLAWYGEAAAWGIRKVLADEESDGIAWCAAAVAASWSWWKEPLAKAKEHDATRVGEQVAVATDLRATKAQLEAALAAHRALPKRGPPPPYAGHFYGGLQHLLEARVATRPAERAQHVADCLSFAPVAPEGKRRVAEIAKAKGR